MSAWDAFLEVLPLIAAGSAFGGVASSVLTVLLRRASVRRERDTLRKADTAAAIASADLPTLGFHMFERLGSASVRNYLSDDEVRNDFNRAFGAVRKYLGQPSEETWASAQPVSNPAAKTATQEERLLLEQSTSEDTWTSLARARRDLETALGAALDLPADDRRRSAGQMVMLAEKRQLLTSDQTTRLREAVNIANHAIHGETVSPEAAADAVVRISALLQKLEAGATPDLLPPTPQPAARRVDVVPGEGDHWRVISGRAGVTKVYGTQREAIDGARDLIYKSGGGEVAIHGRDGRIQARDTVASSRAEKDAARN